MKKKITLVATFNIEFEKKNLNNGLEYPPQKKSVLLGNEGVLTLGILFNHFISIQLS